MTELVSRLVTTTVTTGGLGELRRAVSGSVWDPGEVEVVAEIAGFDPAPVHDLGAVVARTDPDGVLGGRRMGLR